MKELIHILSKLSLHSIQNLDKEVENLVLTSDTVIEAKIGGGAIEEEGRFSVGISLLIKNTRRAGANQTTITNLAQRITLDVHQDSGSFLRLFADSVNGVYQVDQTSLSLFDDSTSAIFFNIHAPLKRTVNA